MRRRKKVERMDLLPEKKKRKRKKTDPNPNTRSTLHERAGPVKPEKELELVTNPWE